MKLSSNIALIVGSLMLILTLINALSVNEITPSIERAEVISALTSISILLIGFLQKNPNGNISSKLKSNAEEGFYLKDDMSITQKNELAWGSHMILTATASATVFLFKDGNVLLRRGLISDDTFIPGKICLTATKKSKYISLVNTKFYPGREEFDSILNNLPSVIVFPISANGWLIIGGWTDRCFTKSDELWIEGWSKKISNIL